MNSLGGTIPGKVYTSWVNSCDSVAFSGTWNFLYSTEPDWSLLKERKLFKSQIHRLYREQLYMRLARVMLLYVLKIFVT